MIETKVFLIYFLLNVSILRFTENFLVLKKINLFLSSTETNQ